MRTSLGVCNRKKRYLTQADAAQAAANATLTLRPYHCALCRDYHLTSRTKGMFVSSQIRHPGLEPGSTFSSNRPKEGGPRIKSGVTSQEKL